MTEETKDLVTKIDVLPDLEGLKAFEAELDRATAKVLKLDAAIKKTNELRPSSKYAPPVVNHAATTAAAGLSAGLGANLVNRTSLAPIVQKAADDVAKSAATGMSLAIKENWTVGEAGGLANPSDFKQNPFNRFNFEGTNWGDGNTLTPGEMKPKRPRTGSGFKMPDMLAGAATAYALSEGLASVAESMDKIQQQEAQLERLPQTIGSGKDALLELNDAASQVRSSGDAFISTYTNMATATEKLKLSQADTVKATQGLVSSLQLGGGSKEAVTNALYQMGQAFSSDRFGGDEFRSFMEAIGTQAPAVAKAFGTDVKGLRAMSTAGKLTAETMVKAFEKMADQNIEMLNKQGWTWGQVTNVMKNDWSSFLAVATSGGEWSKLMSWIMTNVVPTFKSAEQGIAKFWATTTDQSKADILIGILASIGAAFVALAIPVLAAVWPFLAVGAAVWLLFEAFNDFKSWMDGNGGNIFDTLFGSFDELEKRYPHIIKLLEGLVEFQDKFNLKKQLAPLRDNLPAGAQTQLDANAKADEGKPNGLMGMLDWFIGDVSSIPQRLSDLPLLPPALTRNGGGQTNITNSGNTTITVATPEDAVKVANSQSNTFANKINGTGLDNMAEAAGSN